MPKAVSMMHITLAVVVVVTTLKLAILFVVQGDDARLIRFDSVAYLETAQVFAESGRFGLSPEYPDIPQVSRMPLYSAYLALFNPTSTTEASRVALLVQVLLSLATTGGVYWFGRTLWGKRKVALLAVILLSLDITYAAHSVVLLTETIFALLIFVMVGAGVLLMRHGETRWAALCGLALALATLTRPISYYLVIPLAIGIGYWSFQQDWHWLRRGRVMIAFVLPFVLLVGGWQLRNAQLTGSSQISMIQGINMLFYRGAAIVALRDELPFEAAQEQVAGGDIYTLSDYAFLHPEERLGEQWSAAGIALIRDHPLLFLRTQVDGAVAFLFGRGERLLYELLAMPALERTPLTDLGSFLRGRLSVGEYMQTWLVQYPVHTLITLLALLHLLILYVGVLAWVIVATLRRMWTLEHVFVWGVILYFFLLSIGPEANARFRVPLIPLLSLYAAYGWVLWFDRRSVEKTQ